MYWSIFLFPTLLAGNHLILSSYAPFYDAFESRQKYEYLAWMNTVFFQSTFTLLRYTYPDDLHMMAGYFLIYIAHDTAHLTFYDKRPLYYVHHGVASLIALSSPFIPRYYAMSAMSAGSFLESSNILLGITWLLHRAGYETKILGGVSLVTYLTLRNICYPWYLFYYAPRYVQIVMSLFIPMNLYWSWKLVKYIRKISNGTTQTK
jgi:hypothetical protein